MSAQVKTAVVNEALEISNLFTQNCALKHGLPDKPTKQRVGMLTEEKPEPPVVNITNNIPAAGVKESPSPGASAADAVKSSLLRRAAPWLLGAAVPAAGAAGWAINAVLDKDQPAVPAVVVPAVPAEDGSMLQWLQDQGHHVPEGSEWTK